LFLRCAPGGLHRLASPGKKPQFEHKNNFSSATWSAGDMVYIIPTPGDDSDLQQYLD
jgi:hypothetical protein